MEQGREMNKEQRETGYWRAWLEPPRVVWLLVVSLVVLLWGWPFLRQVVVLANCDPKVPGWRVEYYPGLEPQGRPELKDRVTGDHLWLKRADTCLVAQTFWRVDRAGAWRLRAKLDGYAKVWVEGRPVLFYAGQDQPQALEGEFQVAEPGLVMVKAQVWIQAPLGYLGLRALGPGDPDYRLLDDRDLIYPDIDVAIWEVMGKALDLAAWAGLALSLLGLGLTLKRRLAQS